jgi:hypothetical protein
MQVMTMIKPPDVIHFPATEPKERERLWRISQIIGQGVVPISESTLRRMIAEGKIRHKRIGSGRGCLLIPDSEIRRLTELDQS